MGLLSLPLHADFWTGRVQVISGPATPCSEPPSDTPMVDTYQVESSFSYLACKQYRRSDTSVYYHLENAEDGEYIRVIARPGEKSINASDYLSDVATAKSTCAGIRAAALTGAMAVEDSACAGQQAP